MTFARHWGSLEGLSGSRGGPGVRPKKPKSADPVGVCERLFRLSRRRRRGRGRGRGRRRSSQREIEQRRNRVEAPPIPPPPRGGDPGESRGGWGRHPRGCWGFVVVMVVVVVPMPTRTAAAAAAPTRLSSPPAPVGCQLLPLTIQPTRTAKRREALLPQPTRRRYPHRRHRRHRWPPRRPERRPPLPPLRPSVRARHRSTRSPNWRTGCGLW